MKQMHVITIQGNNAYICESKDKAYWVALQDIGPNKIASMVDLFIAEGNMQCTIEDLMDALLEQYQIEIEAVEFINDND